MATKPLILSLGDESASADILHRASETLKAGGLVVAPTETTYGLLVRADSVSSLRRLVEVKGRPSNMATSIFVRDRNHLVSLAELTRNGEILVDKFLPGPLTLVLRDRSQLPEPVVVRGKIGLRWSSHPLVAALVGGLTFPVTATSANVSGMGGENDPSRIRDELGPQVDLILDAGRVRSVVSTVIDCSSGEPTILREGAITREAIEAATGARVL